MPPNISQYMDYMIVSTEILLSETSSSCKTPTNVWVALPDSELSQSGSININAYLRHLFGIYQL